MNFPRLKIDDKWSIEYNPNMNDMPMYWFRYDERKWPFDENNGVVAMFYALMEKNNEH